MMRDENRVKKREKYLILLNKLAGVVQWQNGSFAIFLIQDLAGFTAVGRWSRVQGRSSGNLQAPVKKESCQSTA